jgi:hypothetical protein
MGLPGMRLSQIQNERWVVISDYMFPTAEK